jgi:hypothetical protein
VNRFTARYVGTVIGTGTLVVVGNLPQDYSTPALLVTAVIAMLVVSLFKLRLPLGRGQSTMSMAYVIDFLVLVTAGADLAMAIAAAGVIVQCTVRVRVRQPWYRAAFSVAAVAMAVQAAGWTWIALGGSSAVAGSAASLIALAVAAAVYFVINSGLVAGAIALSTGTAPARCWQQNFLCTAPAYVLGGVGVAALQPMATSEALLLFEAAAMPMLVVYLAYAYWFRQAAARLAAPALT